MRRLQQRFDSTVISKAIQDSIQALGYTDLREGQLANFIAGRDVFVSLPTGTGKSLCFACLPLVFDILRGTNNKSIGVVVAPLNSLMQDQVAKFTAQELRLFM